MTVQYFIDALSHDIPRDYEVEFVNLAGQKLSDSFWYNKDNKLCISIVC